MAQRGSTIQEVPAASSGRWWQGASKQQWGTFRSAYLGWMLDVMDLMLFAMVLKHVSADLGFDKSQAGMVMSATLMATAFGGLVFGYLADRMGRAKSACKQPPPKSRRPRFHRGLRGRAGSR